MNKKIMRLARGTMCGSGAICRLVATARWAAIADQASQPKPQAADCKNVRRSVGTENGMSDEGVFMGTRSLHYIMNERNDERPRAAFPRQADNQKKGKKIKWQKNRRSK
jgi:hypothetical protein